MPLSREVVLDVNPRDYAIVTENPELAGIKDAVPDARYSVNSWGETGPVNRITVVVVPLRAPNIQRSMAASAEDIGRSLHFSMEGNNQPTKNRSACRLPGRQAVGTPLEAGNKFPGRSRRKLRPFGDPVRALF